jgi:isopentenyldiphosphate isomerase
MDIEILDVVDGHDRVIGTVNRKDYKQFMQDNRGYLRAAELFFMNDEGKIWVPVRTADKTIAPNGYDYSAAGHVVTGEDYLDTAIRETKEEVNVDLAVEDITFVATLKSESIKYIRRIYLVRTNATPVINPQEFQSAEWMSPAELIASIDNGHLAKDGLRDAAATLQAYLVG